MLGIPYVQVLGPPLLQCDHNRIWGSCTPIFFFCYVYSSHTQTPPRHEACPRVLHVPFGTVVPLSIHMLISFLLIAQVFYSNSYFLYARWWFSVLSLRSFVQKKQFRHFQRCCHCIKKFIKYMNWYTNFIIYCLVWFDHKPKFVCGGRGRAGFSLPSTNSTQFSLFGYGRREKRQRGNSH